ncbi:YIP1 family protein [Phaeovulum vinaykumarii]|uniref:Yip1 domain-containing protein n=1 Tax=Phaeovulum vinaykumarii TaxID=407234 RepID=A0A1N7JIJ1_9RHOB|nr:YIP1 family protein [Phaeovulum vinaykumarii]SIS49147.1 Yip1 domain-containing protein [Phaeovulum vinaykumarii]SOB89426.1 Yip1-like protein [Phaeovulum vinaykumarii]
MELKLSELLDLGRESVMRPRAAAARVLRLDLSYDAVLTAMGAVIACSAILGYLANVMFPAPVQTPWSVLTGSPLLMVIVQALGVLVTALGMTHVGRLFGGTGGFFGALVLTVWLETVLLGLQVLQVALMPLFPLFAEMLGLAGFVLFFWLLSHFTAELHDFPSVALVFVGTLGTLMAVAVVLSFLLALLGFASH